MPRRSDSEPTLGQPGSVWIWRGKTDLADSGKKVVEKPPKNEAAAVAWKAIRKPTLHGALGTHNKISSVIQFPISTKDPFNMYQGSRRHLSAEDRRLMRVMVKHSLRHSPHYPEAVYEVEKKLIEAFGKNPHLKGAFFTNEDFAVKTLGQMAFTIDSNGQGKEAEFEEPLQLKGEARLVPGCHSYACGPQCYCLKSAPAALTAKAPEDPSEFVDTFANKTQNATDQLLNKLGASRRKRHASATR